MTDYVYHYDAVLGNTVIRPGLTDVGGGAKEDDQEYPPDPVTMPCADDANQSAFLLAGYGQVIPPIGVTIEFAAGVPQIKYLAAVDYNLAAGDLTVVDNGVGDTTVYIAATKVPARFLDPRGATINDAATQGTIRAAPYAAGANIGVRVYTYDAGVATDLGFSVTF